MQRSASVALAAVPARTDAVAAALPSTFTTRRTGSAHATRIVGRQRIAGSATLKTVLLDFADARLKFAERGKRLAGSRRFRFHVVKGGNAVTRGGGVLHRTGHTGPDTSDRVRRSESAARRTTPRGSASARRREPRELRGPGNACPHLSSPLVSRVASRPA